MTINIIHMKNNKHNSGPWIIWMKRKKNIKYKKILIVDFCLYSRALLDDVSPVSGGMAIECTIEEAPTTGVYLHVYNISQSNRMFRRNHFVTSVCIRNRRMLQFIVMLVHIRGMRTYCQNALNTKREIPKWSSQSETTTIYDNRQI